MLEISLFLILGLVVGTISGLIGIGGGVLLTPALVYLFGFTQHSAQGTTLALLVPPVSLLAAWTYYEHGDVNLKVATLIFLGFFVGGLIGAKFAVTVPEVWLKRGFGVAMLALGIKMIMSTGQSNSPIDIQGVIDTPSTINVQTVINTITQNKI